MNLLTPEQTVQLIKNGHNPDADHVPVALVETRQDGETIMAFMLTHVDVDRPDVAYGLIDFGHGKPRLSMVFIPQIEKHQPRYALDVEAVKDFAGEYPISVYAQAARMMQKITTNKAALQMAATHLELTKARDQFVSPLRGDGPGFLPFPSSPN